MDLFDDSDGSLDWSPSELAAEERRWRTERAESVSSGVDPMGPRLASEHDAQWRCIRCHTSAWVYDDERGYLCQQCGGSEFFNVHRPTKLELPTGTWMYVPNRNDSAGSDNLSGEARCDEPWTPGSAWSSPTADNCASGRGSPKLA